MIFSREEYLSRLAKVKKSMGQKNMDVIILTDPSNMHYLTGYDGWSFYVPQGIIVALELDEPIWFGRRQDSKGAKVTTYLQDKNIIYYPEDLIQSPPTHPYDFVSSFIHENNWSNKNIGAEMDAYYYTAENHYRLTSTCPNVNFSDATLLVNWIRLIKSPNEITYMKEGAKLVEAGMKTAYENIKPGVKQSYVAGKIQDTLIGGGRYNGLIKLLGGKDIAGVGWAGGIERIMLLMKNFPKKQENIHLAILDPNFKLHAIKIYDFLIKNNFSIYWNYKYNLKKSLSYANEKKINYLIIVGENEKANNNFSIKNLSNGKQDIVNIDNILNYLK